MTSYPYQNGASGSPSRHGRGSGDRGFWLAAVLLLFFFPPVGILMIVVKVLGGGRKRTNVQGQHPYYAQQNGSVGARTVHTGTSGPNQASSLPVSSQVLAKLSLQAKRLTIVGMILSLIFGFTSVSALAGSLWMLPDLAWYLEATVPILCFFFGSLGCLWVGLRKRNKVRRCRKYLAMLGSRTVISISALSSALGTPPAKVRDELSDMLDDGLFPLWDIWTTEMIVSFSPARACPTLPLSNRSLPKKSTPKEDPQAVVLQEIRTINDQIDNPKLSQQIDRIGVITAKVFEYQRNHPQKSPQLHSFLSYYLPTTLKILRAYAQLEDQEVNGENISAAMERIENMMDKVVEGFEKQLDQLFQGDALDVTADVEVLERMLAKDGLSSQDGPPGRLSPTVSFALNCCHNSDKSIISKHRTTSVQTLAVRCFSFLFQLPI